MNKNITESVIYVGVDDKTLDFFEGQYLVPNGVSYNSYIIMDEKIAIMDTVDARAIDEWMENIDKALEGKTPDYLVVSHMEPDHSSGIKKIIEKYPDLQVVANGKIFNMMPQFRIDLADSRKVTVAEGDTLDLGSRTLTFVMAPMVHWPEVMVEYDSKDKILFSADAFGKFGALDADEDWACEARRYYVNIVGKYGAQATALLKKAEALDIQIICPLHGPILSENLEYYIGKYKIWAGYEVESEGVVVAYSSMHGCTAQAAREMADILEKAGSPKVVLTDLVRDDMAEAVEDAFRYGKLIIASPTYDAGLMPVMEDFLYHLKMKNYQKKKVGFIENGSWAPMAGKLMKAKVEEFKNVEICDTTVTIKSMMNDANKEQMEALAKEILA